MTRTAAAPKLPAAAHYHHLAGVLRDLEGALRHGLSGGAFIPEDWQAVARRAAVPGKAKLTLRVDEDVLAFFRLMGRGYLTQMNAVLRAFMLARLAGVLGGAETVAYAPTPLERYLAEAKDWLEAMMRRNARAAAGVDTGAEDLVLDRRLRALDLLADEAGIAQEDRMRG
jgi:hypothetical protein